MDEPTRKCTECNKNPATHGDFCDSCFNETKICRRCQLLRKSIFEFQKNQKSIAGKVSRRGECIECRKWKKSISNKLRVEFEKINLPPPLGQQFHCPVCQHTIIRQFKNDVVLDHNHNMQAFVTLDVLAKALGIPSSKGGEVESKNVAKAFENGRIKEICEYCERDVEVTRKIYKRMTLSLSFFEIWLKLFP